MGDDLKNMIAKTEKKVYVENIASRLEKFIAANKNGFVKTPSGTKELIEYIEHTQNPAETSIAVSMALNSVGQQLNQIIEECGSD